MRWSVYNNEFIRPIKWITILLDNKIIKFKFNNIKSNNYTYGNKFIDYKKIHINIINYENELEEKGLVLIDYKKRKNKIQTDLKYIENIYIFSALINKFLLKEIINLSEFPYIIKCEFKNIYLKLPTEIIILIIQKYCKAIPIKKNNKITNFFLTTSNIQLNNNAKDWFNFSLNSKLSKIMFIFNNNNTNYYENKINKLKNIIFQEKLGSMYNKIKRLKKITSYIVKKTKIKIKYINLNKTILYSKLDLTTMLVSEIPELEGIIGSYYIKKNKKISIGIREQYKPKTVYDNIPKTKIGKILSLADKIDTIIGLLIINKFPTGSKDPYSIKRKIMGIIRIITEANINFNIKKILIISLKFFSKKDFQLFNKIYLYIKKKLENFLKYKKYNTKILFSLKNTQNINTTYKKLNALSMFFSNKENMILVTISSRIKNIIPKHFKTKTKINLDIIEISIEKKLIKIYFGIKIINKELYRKRKFSYYLYNCKKFEKYIDNLFENTKVLNENTKIKNNRIELLGNINNLICKISDIYKLK